MAKKEEMHREVLPPGARGGKLKLHAKPGPTSRWQHFNFKGQLEHCRIKPSVCAAPDKSPEDFWAVLSGTKIK